MNKLYRCICCKGTETPEIKGKAIFRTEVAIFLILGALSSTSSAFAQQVIADGTVETVPGSTTIDTGTVDGIAGNGLVARNGGTINVLGPVTITTGGNAAHAVNAEGGSAQATVTLNGGSITTTGTGYGLRASGANSLVQATDMTINGNDTALFAGGGGHITIARSSVTTTHYGMHSLGIGSSIDATDMSITTHNNSQQAVEAYQGNIQFHGTNLIQTDGVNSYGLLSQVNGVIAAESGLTINTQGNGAHGVFARSSGNATLGGVVVSTQGAVAHGFSAESGGTISSTGTVRITTSGANAHGANANGGQIILAGDGTATSAINTSGDGSYGLRAIGATSNIQASGLTINTTGNLGYGIDVENGGYINLANSVVNASEAGGHAAVLTGGSSFDVTNSSLFANGSGASALFMSGAAGQINTANLTNVQLASAASSSILVSSGTANINLIDSQAITNSSNWLEVGIPSVSEAIANVFVDPSHVRGAAVTAVGSTSNVTLANSLWEMTGNSNITNLTSNGSTIQFGAPNGDILQASSYKTLTANNYGSNGGIIGLNTYLGTDGSPSDKLVVDGGVATGNTALWITATGGNGGLISSDGIRVVNAINGATTATDAFVLGNRVAAGAYEYQLYKGGSAESGGNASSQDWYLRNTVAVIDPEVVPPAPPTIDVPNYRAEIPLDMAIPALAHRFGLDMLGTYHDRVGEDYGDALVEPSTGNDDKPYRSWGRVFGASGNVGENSDNTARSFNKFLNNGPSYDFSSWGFQVGMDLLDKKREDGLHDTAGMYLGSGRIDADVDAVLGGKAGTASMSGLSLGGYWTRKSDKDWYIDGVLQGTHYDQVRTTSLYGERLDSNGWGATASIEGGHAFNLGNYWAIEPQAQLVYQYVSLKDNLRDDFGLISYGNTDNVYGRVGARLTKNLKTNDGRPVTVWARANVWHGFGSDAETTFSTLNGQSPVTLNTNLGDTWSQVGVGLSGQIAKNVSIFGAFDYNRTLGNSNGSGVSGRIGMKVVW